MIKKMMIFILLVGCLVGCVDQGLVPPHPLYGNHELRKMFQHTNLEHKGGSFSGFFLLGIGLASGSGEQTTKETVVTFAWKNRSEEYVVSTLPIRKIRVKFDESVTIPYVKFRWRGAPYHYNDGNPMQHVIYSVIVCNEKQWPSDINMPLNGGA